jgi:hypothetical protein
MKNYLCKDCMHNEYETEADAGSRFPAFTIVGGIFGAALSILTGSFVFVPVGLLAGAGSDVVRCESCGSDEDVHQTMSTEDGEEGRTYSPVDSMGGMGGNASFWDDGSQSRRGSHGNTKYRYDEIEEKLVPVGNRNSYDVDSSGDSGFDWSVQPAPETHSESGPDIIEETAPEDIPSGTDIPAYVPNADDFMPEIEPVPETGGMTEPAGMPGGVPASDGGGE